LVLFFKKEHPCGTPLTTAAAHLIQSHDLHAAASLHPSDAMTRRIAVVGAGPGGLAAAMLLARAGAAVTVFERAPQVGGRTASIEAPSRVGNFRFDMGPTFFLYPRILAEIFASCGADLAREVELIRLDPQYELVFGAGGRLRATPDPARMQAEIARLAPGDAAGLQRFMDDNRRKLDLFRPVLEMPFNSMADMVSAPMRRALPMLRPWRSVDQDLATHFSDERVRLAFSFQSKYLGMSPFRCPSLFSILSFMEYEHGVFHPRGGCGAVMTAMERVARRMGVRFRLGTAVRELVLDGRRVRGVRTDSGTDMFDAVVLNADFAEAMRTLVPNTARSRWTDRRIARKKFSCSTFMLYLGVEGRLDDVAHHTIYLTEEYRRNIADIEAGEAPETPSFYVQNACVTDPGLAPPGHSTLYVLVPVGNLAHGRVNWPAVQTAYRGKILAMLARIGITDIERRIRFERILTPAGWAAQGVHIGATFNLAHSIDQMMVFRPHNRFEDLDGVYLVGGGTHPGSGLPVIFEGARISARLLCEDLGMALDAGAAAGMMDATGAVPPGRVAA
jgi:phytoene desaturase